MVDEEPEYTLWGWILLSMFGITPKPDHVVYRCQLCRQSLGSTRDPKVLARRTGPKKAAEPMPPSPSPASTTGEGSSPEENSRT